MTHFPTFSHQKRKKSYQQWLSVDFGDKKKSICLVIQSLRNELIINLRFWLDLFAASLVKKPRDSAAIPTFFA